MTEDADDVRREPLAARSRDASSSATSRSSTRRACPCCGASPSSAEPGTSTALVGPSGSGKSTMIGLVAAFYRPDRRPDPRGRPGPRERRASPTTARQLGVVLQDNFLFDGTVLENIAYARPDASDEDVLRAARIARCDDFVEKLPDKYETIVGERGIKLSGGQRQRVAIARAILADPRILILDEATSSLDSESEALIQEGLTELMRGRTTFVIAHRLSTIRKADTILVVEAGRDRRARAATRSCSRAAAATRTSTTASTASRRTSSATPASRAEEPEEEKPPAAAAADAGWRGCRWWGGRESRVRVHESGGLRPGTETEN